MIKKFLLFFIIVFLNACSIQQENGYYFMDKNKIDNFDVYNFNKQDVIDNIGLPSIELDNNVWLYYSYTTKNPNFLKPKIDKETILIIYFNSDNSIKNFNLINRDKVNNLKHNLIEDKEQDKNIQEDSGNIFFRLFDGLIFTPIQ